MRIEWRQEALTSARGFMIDQAGMRAVNQAVTALADDPEPPEAFIRGTYRRLHVGPYRVLYEVEGDLVVIVRVDRVTEE